MGSSDTVKSLKERIYKWAGPAVNIQVLDFEGYVIDDNDILLADFLDDGDELCLTANVPQKDMSHNKKIGKKTTSTFMVTAQGKFKMSRNTLSTDSGLFALVDTLQGGTIGQKEFQAEFYDVKDKDKVEVKVEDEKAVVYADGERQEPERVETYNEKKLIRQSSFNNSLKQYIRNYSSFLNNIGNAIKAVQNLTE